MFFQRYKYTSYTERRLKRLKFFRICLIILLVFIVQLLIRSYIITTYRVQAATMQPAFTPGDLIISSPLYSVQPGIERGTLVMVEPFEKHRLPFFKNVLQEAVLFATLQLFAPFDDAAQHHAKPFVRRIVGMPGDTVYMENFILHIKTKGSSHFLTEFEVAEKDYNVKNESLPENWDSDLPFSGTYPEITLKEDEYFVLCDNRIASGDSRLWGPVKADVHIKSCVLLRYWPLSQFSIF
ncbi:MAG: signal peptidase I [Treponema sp.]